MHTHDISFLLQIHHGRSGKGLPVVEEDIKNLLDFGLVRFAGSNVVKITEFGYDYIEKLTAVSYD